MHCNALPTNALPTDNIVEKEAPSDDSHCQRLERRLLVAPILSNIRTFELVSKSQQRQVDWRPLFITISFDENT